MNTTTHTDTTASTPTTDSNPAPIANTAAPRKRGRSLKYPWDTMNVGDAFFVAGKQALSAVSAAQMYGKRHSRQFESHAHSENGADGRRILRSA